MKQAYLIAAFTNFEHLKILIETLDSKDTLLFLGIDAKSEYPSFIRELHTCNPIVVLHDKRVEWGDQSLIVMELDLFAKAYENPEIEWFHLISGTDFPLRSIDEINKFFEESKDIDGFMESEPLPDHLTDRVELYHLYVRRPSENGLILNWITRKLLAMQRRLKICRKHPKGKPFMYGSNWVDLRRRAVEVLLSNSREILRVTKLAACADEIYKQTFLQGQGLSIMDDNLRYIDWSARKPSPKSLKVEDFQNIMRSGKLFARKFDSPESPQLRDMIIESINGMQPESNTPS